MAKPPILAPNGRPLSAPVPAAPAPQLHAHSCGNCSFSDLAQGDLTQIDCFGVPPTPAVIGMSPQGPAIGLLRPRLPRGHRGCALWRMRGEAEG